MNKTSQPESAPVESVVRTPGPWRPCGASDGKCQCRMIWSEAADCVVGVAIMAQDEQYTCGEGIVDPEVAALNQSLMADAPALLEALRKLHDFAEPSTHYRDGERSKQAFATAIELLKKHGG